MTQEKTIREELESAMAEATTPDDPADVVDPVEDTPEPDMVGPTGPVEPVETTPAIEAPQSWTAPMKEKWGSLTPDVQAEIIRRENDFHKVMTSRDSELNLGKQMKEIITPYMPIITAEGGNPAAAVQSLLNTAYQLRTGTPQQKAALVQQIAQQYGVDLGQLQAQPQEVNYLQSLQNELAQLKQQMNPQAIISQLQEQQEQGKIVSEISAFAANPANKHFEQVKAAMAPLLDSGQAKDLQEAYDMACWANPTIRSTLLASQEAEKQAKRKAELNAKKQAAVSVTGSPSYASGNPSTPERSLREELAANMAAISGSKI